MKVLVVEDNKKVAQFLVRAMEEEGFAVDHVNDGAEALLRIESIRYDVVVLDWMLPETDGITVCRTVRKKGNTTPILMLTARGDVEERVFGLDAGADDYLPKPFDLGELLARVRALGRRAGGDSAAVVRLGPLVLDRTERRVTVDGARVDLTPREFALLAHLARDAGRVVARTDLLARVWGMTFDPTSNVVEVHVKNLRDKLPTDSVSIETVRGVGYRLVVARKGVATDG